MVVIDIDWTDIIKNMLIYSDTHSKYRVHTSQKRFMGIGKLR